MKQITRFFSLVVIIATSVFLFTKCEKEYSKSSMKNEFASISTLVMPKISENSSIGFKSASVPQIDSIEVYFYYSNEGSWAEVSRSNFNSGSDANLDFKNPLKVSYSDTIQLPYVTKAQCKFVFQGYDASRNKAFRGQVEQDLRDAEDGWEFPTNLFETKSYLGLRVVELVPSEDSCVFQYEYVAKEIDSAATLNNLGTFGSTFPNFYLESSGITVSGELVVYGEDVNLNSSSVNYFDYIDIVEIWNGSAPEGVNWTFKSYRDGAEIVSSTFNENWLALGENNYVQVLNSTSGSSSFTIIHNDDVYTDLEIIPDLNEGLIAYYDFEETSGNLLDVTGNGHDGTNNGATRGVSGKVNNCYSFNGSNNYISLGSANAIVGGLSNITVSLWINPNQIDYRGLIFTSSNGINPNDDSVVIQFWEVNNSIDVSFHKDGGGDIGNVSHSSDQLVQGTWYYLSAVLDEDSVKFYINGIKVESNARTYQDGLNTTTNTLVFGRLGSYSTYYFEGLMDEAGIWNRALSTEEVLRLYNSGQGLSYSDF